MFKGTKIRRAIINLILETIHGNKVCKVKSVDETTHTCVVEPIGGGVPYYDVRINASATNEVNGLVCIPDIDSEVIISPLNNDAHAWAITKFSKVKKWRLNTVSNGVIELDINGNIILNGGSLGGVPKVNPLLSKINALETSMNQLKTILGVTWIVTPNDGGAALKVAASTWAGASITPTTLSDLENTKVKHG